MERIQRLERANFRWRLSSILAFAGILGLGAYAFSQREQQKAPLAQPAVQGNFPIDQGAAPVTYTNFVRVSVTPEELILDLALNTQVEVDPKEPIRVSNRLVMNYFTAKRLSNALQGVVKQHEDTYGPIELDFKNRMLPAAKKGGGN
jgi:hypothetical protein